MHRVVIQGEVITCNAHVRYPAQLGVEIRVRIPPRRDVIGGVAHINFEAAECDMVDAGECAEGGREDDSEGAATTATECPEEV